jgi:hypothetical protein
MTERRVDARSHLDLERARGLARWRSGYSLNRSVGALKDGVRSHPQRLAQVHVSLA